MHIFYSPNQDPMLLDTRVGLAGIHQRIEVFLLSESSNLELAAETAGDPRPSQEFLPGLRITKTEGSIHLRQANDKWLELSGSIGNLRIYASHFLFDKEDGHHHPEYVSKPGYLSHGTMSLIIEADSGWAQEPSE